jgi:hypothetical protein
MSLHENNSLQAGRNRFTNALTGAALGYALTGNTRSAAIGGVAGYLLGGNEKSRKRSRTRKIKVKKTLSRKKLSLRRKSASRTKITRRRLSLRIKGGYNAQLFPNLVKIIIPQPDDNAYNGGLTVRHVNFQTTTIGQLYHKVGAELPADVPQQFYLECPVQGIIDGQGYSDDFVLGVGNLDNDVTLNVLMAREDLEERQMFFIVKFGPSPRG